jgi:hypothetical protein
MPFPSQGWGIGAWGANGGGGGGGGTPQVVNVNPTPGTQLRPTDVVLFDVIDTGAAFRRIVVYAKYGDASEIVHDGNVFYAAFSHLSSQVVIANGFRYVLSRTGGWPQNAPVNIVVDAVDVNGNED